MDIDATRILIVDDSAVVRKSLTKLLEESGAEVTAAEDGEKGLEKISENCVVSRHLVGGFERCLREGDVR